MQFYPIPQKYSRFSPWYLMATWFHIGRFRPASGTWGTFGALPFIYVVHCYAGAFGLTVMALFLFFIGLKACQDYAEKTGEKDSSAIVIDEVVGMTIALIPLVEFDTLMWSVAFICFRIFDAVKIGPVGWCDRRVKGALGVMIDDVVAAFMTICILILIKSFLIT